MYICFQFHVLVFGFGVTGGLHKTVRESSAQPQAYRLFLCPGWTAQNSKRKQGASHKPTDHFGAQLSLEELLVAGRKGRLTQVATGLSHGQGQAVLHHKLQQRPEGEKSVDVSGMLADH